MGTSPPLTHGADIHTSHNFGAQEKLIAKLRSFKPPAVFRETLNSLR